MIRKAKASDKEAIAELCYIIWEELEIDMVKQIERERLLKVMQKPWEFPLEIKFQKESVKDYV